MQLRPYFALSRTPHGLLDMAAPVLTAFLWAGGFPAPVTVLVGLVTVFAAYTGGYAVNDVIDRVADRRRLAGGWSAAPGYLDATLPRHPLATGAVPTRKAAAWTAGWGLVAAAGTLYLSRLSFAVFVAAVGIEVLYCLMYRLTALRALVSGVVKTMGPIAAVFAVTSRPSLPALLLLFLWLFFWEIGGQNIPSDWTDIDEDRALGAKTIPTRLGPSWSARLALGSLILAVLFAVAFAYVVAGRGRIAFAAATAGIGVVLLIVPATRLAISVARPSVFRLFNRASYYPAALLAAALAVRAIVAL